MDSGDDKSANNDSNAGGGSSSKRKDPPTSNLSEEEEVPRRNPKRGSSSSGFVNGGSYDSDEAAATATAGRVLEGMTTSSSANDMNVAADDGAIEMTQCPRCQHDVPVSNLQVHEAACGRGSSAAASASIAAAGAAGGPNERQQQQQQQQQQLEDEGHQANVTVEPSAPPSDGEGWEVVENNVEGGAAAAAPAPAGVPWDGPGTREEFEAIMAEAMAMPPSSPPVAVVQPSAPPFEINHDEATAAAVPPAAAAAAASPGGDGGEGEREEENEWSCPRCTLLNDPAAPRCDACLLPRPGVGAPTASARAGATAAGLNAGGMEGMTAGGIEHMSLAEALGPAFRPDLLQRQLQQQQHQQQRGQRGQPNITIRRTYRTSSSPSSPNYNAAGSIAGTANSIISGAVIGSVFGGAVGAAIGAAGGALVDGVTRFNNWRARAAAANGGGGAGNAGGAAGNSSSQGGVGRAEANQGGGGGRISYSARTIPGTGMRVVTIRSTGGPINPANLADPNLADPNLAGMSDVDRFILRMLLSNAAYQGVGDPNSLDYEELLERFGVGTERQRRGATPELINSVPLIEVANLEEDLPGDNERTCGICLEDFGVGDKVRKLGCGHVFHRECGDRWLRQVASCPICKREVTAAASGEGGEGDVKDGAAQRRRREEAV